MRFIAAFVASIFLLESVSCRPQPVFVASTTTTPSTTTTNGTWREDTEVPKATISKMHIRSDIQFRYAKTVVQSLVKNPSLDMARQVDFELVLPEKSFISNFTIETGGKTYVSRVEKKAEAKRVYAEAVSAGTSAALVDARAGNVFAVQANVGAAEKVLFTLTYEQLLERRLSRYEHVVNLNPKQVVSDLKVDVFINESLPLLSLNVPKLKESSNEITAQLEANSIVLVNGQPFLDDLVTSADPVHIEYRPSVAFQKNADEDTGLSGQFIVQYDVDRKNQSSEVQVYDGYMVHFFAPENLKVLPKHVVFVLDVSGSMSGDKMTQLKNAMVTILGDLSPQDYFSIMTFSYGVSHWSAKGELESEEGPHRTIYEASKSYFVDEAMDYVLDLEAEGGTNINDALLEAVDVVQEGERTLSGNVPVVIFLTDGQPTSGEFDHAKIRANLKAKNSDARVPVYGLAFGSGADYGLLKGIASDNRAFARKIFADSDSAIQLEDFYTEISSPLLNNVTFEYVGESLEAPTENIVPTTCFHSGSEIVSVVRLTSDDPNVELVVRGDSVDGDYETKISPCTWPQGNDSRDDIIGQRRLPCFPLLPPIRQRPVNFIERLWAYLSIEKLMDDKTDSNLAQKEREEKATDLALKYNFVTDLTSLVVVKPDLTTNATSDEKDESVAVLRPVGEAAKKQSYYGNVYAYQSVPAAAPQAMARPFSSSNSAPPMHQRVFKQHNRPQMKIASGGAPAPPPPVKPNMSNRRFYSAAPTIAPYYTSTTTYNQGVNNRVANDYDYDYASFGSDSNVTTQKPCDVSKCRLELYAKTLLRGVPVKLTNDTSDLSDVAFDNKVISLKVVGPCTWNLYKETDYGGVHKAFATGSYRNAIDLAKIFRKASSVKIDGCS